MARGRLWGGALMFFPAGSGLVTGPTVNSITPSTGSEMGGTVITDLAGTNFAPGAMVTIGGSPATSVVRVSATKITCIVPAGTIGAQDVVVTNPDTHEGTLEGGFTYTAFVPTDIPDLAWWSEPGLGTITTVGAKASVFAALGGSKSATLIFSQATDAERPTYHANGGPNNIPYLTGTADTLMSSAVEMFASGTARTMVMAAKLTTYGSGGNVLFANKATSGTRWVIVLASATYIYTDAVAINKTLTPFPSEPTLTAPFVIDVRNAALPSALLCAVNSVEQTVDPGNINSDTGDNGCSLMGRGPFAQGMIGDFYGGAWYSRVLTPTELGYVRNYFEALVN